MKGGVICLLAVLLLILQSANAQNADLKDKLETKQDEISLTNELLSSAKSASVLTINKLRLLNAKIETRHQLLKSLDQQIIEIDKSIQRNVDSIRFLESFLKDLVNEYEKMIYYAYKNRSNYQRMLFILASEDFNQAYKRLLYLRQYADYRKKQVGLIEKTRIEFQAQNKILELEKREKRELIKIRKRENRYLATEKDQQTAIIESLQKQKQEIMDQMEKELEVTETIEQSVSELISHSFAGKSVVLDSEEKEIYSSKFKKEKGRLPWPVEKGIVIKFFGRHKHPFLKGIYIFNNGISISTIKGSNAKSVFDGYVSNVVSIPGANMAVLINHGDFYTLYSNLVSVNVKAGDKISQGQDLGKIYTDKTDNNITVLQFQVWQKDQKLNPSRWIRGTYRS